MLAFLLEGTIIYVYLSTSGCTIGKLIVIQITFLHTKLKKLVNWQIYADKLVYEPFLTKVVGQLDLCYGKVNANVLSRLKS
ncbi:hypothetical protein CK510_01370 [Brunnivagina elsteri CCALA 953]|uniref:Uncharacterized protein n=1 Tax=Brunnivagina elsteri CCALA 953 TaxID=987040 RepID=A0A2A2TQ40_9CYAN|nr:hypothetical protein CK510_01370 [Calothrix elsteri CCALA 953]